MISIRRLFSICVEKYVHNSSPYNKCDPFRDRSCQIVARFHEQVSEISLFHSIPFDSYDHTLPAYEWTVSLYLLVYLFSFTLCPYVVWMWSLDCLQTNCQLKCKVTSLRYTSFSVYFVSFCFIYLWIFLFTSLAKCFQRK